MGGEAFGVGSCVRHRPPTHWLRYGWQGVTGHPVAVRVVCCQGHSGGEGGGALGGDSVRVEPGDEGTSVDDGSA